MTFQRLAGVAAFGAGLAGLAYSVAFVGFDSDTANGLFLLLGGVLALPVFVGLYERVRDADPGLALLGLLLGAFGAIGAATHGGYDLANGLHPPEAAPDVPNFADPRGLATFGLTGAALLVLALLARRAGALPAGLTVVGVVLGVLLVVVYLARLIVLDADSLWVVVPALPAGFVANPVWYAWLGRELLRSG